MCMCMVQGGLENNHKSCPVLKNVCKFNRQFWVTLQPRLNSTRLLCVTFVACVSFFCPLLGLLPLPVTRCVKKWHESGNPIQTHMSDRCRIMCPSFVLTSGIQFFFASCPHFSNGFHNNKFARKCSLLSEIVYLWSVCGAVNSFPRYKSHPALAVFRTRGSFAMQNSVRVCQHVAEHIWIFRQDTIVHRTGESAQLSLSLLSSGESPGRKGGIGC